MNILLDWLVLPTIVFAQFAGTSTWFAPNAVVSLVGFDERQAAILVSCVQVGFILGTFTLTYLAAADRISPPFLFCLMTLIGAVLNAICLVSVNYFALWVVLRTLVGFSLAGVYPVGMKIAAMEYPSGLGARLGVLVGALTLGTAFPWLVRGIGDSTGNLPYQATIAAVSILATIGAANMALIMIPRQGGPGAEFFSRVLSCCCCYYQDQGTEKDDQNDAREDRENCGPGHYETASGTIHIQKRQQDEKESEEQLCDEVPSSTCHAEESQRQDDTVDEPLSGMTALRALFADSRFRAATIGYVGHMWEIYAFWTWVPNLIESHATNHDGVLLGNVALTSFATIAIGSVSSAIAGVWSLYAGRNVLPGSAVAAEVMLFMSLICCLLAPAYQSMSQGVFLFYLLVWGSAVVADSAQFSSLSAMYACPGLVGTGLTLTTCIGFAISVASIQVVGVLLQNGWDPGNALALLAIGPFFGVGLTYKEWPLHLLLRPWRKKLVSESETSRF